LFDTYATKLLISPSEEYAMHERYFTTFACRCLVASLEIAAIRSLNLLPSSLHAEEANTLSESEKLAGWTLLFDGKSADHFRNYKQDKISDGWKVQDGSLVKADKGAGDIVTKDEYGSFELLVDFKVSKGGNSGIMFHVKEGDGPPWHTGPEIQINDAANGHDPQKAGWLYQLYTPGIDRASGKEIDAFRGHDEWNQLYLKVTPQQCEIDLNGVRYASFKKGSKDWDDRISKSKFKAFENFGKPTAGHICLQDHGDLVSFRNITVRKLPPDAEISEPIAGTLKLKPVVAFENLKWTGWEPVNADGKNIPLRPIVLTHAGDGSNRVFVATQRGVIHSFAPDAKESNVYFDMQPKVAYADNQNEEGFLGLAFHPKYKENGEFFVYYTSSAEKQTSYVSRFKVSKDDPNKADPDFEEKLMRIEQPFWNHNGGTLAFGPDGGLYIALGDGGAGNDPFKNAQDLGNLLGKVLRIDVDNKDDGLNYAIPKDNPFVGKEGARGEVYAYGFRNPWRIAFDRKTGDLWMGEVGQNLWEEINIVTKGGNYGWSVLEGTHPFGEVSPGDKSLIDPIWQYDHGIGKSITGGTVYRGPIESLQGKYIYADYVSGKLYALKYDTAAKKVISNESIPSEKMPVLSFGEDEQGEVYFLIVAADGHGVYKFAKD